MRATCPAFRPPLLRSLPTIPAILRSFLFTSRPFPELLISRASSATPTTTDRLLFYSRLLPFCHYCHYYYYWYFRTLLSVHVITPLIKVTVPPLVFFIFFFWRFENLWIQRDKFGAFDFLNVSLWVK